MQAVIDGDAFRGAVGIDAARPLSENASAEKVGDGADARVRRRQARLQGDSSRLLHRQEGRNHDCTDLRTANESYVL